MSDVIDADENMAESGDDREDRRLARISVWTHWYLLKLFFRGLGEWELQDEELE